MHKKNYITPDQRAYEGAVRHLHLLDKTLRSGKYTARLRDHSRKHYPCQHAGCKVREVSYEFLMKYVRANSTQGKYPEPEAQGGPEGADCCPTISLSNIVPTKAAPKRPIMKTVGEIVPHSIELRVHLSTMLPLENRWLRGLCGEGA